MGGYFIGNAAYHIIWSDALYLYHAKIKHNVLCNFYAIEDDT